jgi:nucleotide-binding universal stress UspA family protein
MAGRIVVGVDGSEGASQALRWAYNEARLRNASLEIVQAWHYPYMADVTGMAAAAVRTDDLEDAIRASLDRFVDETGPWPTDVAATRRLVEGGAAGALVEAATGADLLVVGSRGHGGFAGLLLGSVSQQCAHHAPCPVVIVPNP